MDNVLESMDQIEKTLNSFLESSNSFFNSDYNSYLRKLLNIKNMFLERCCFKIGDRVK